MNEDQITGILNKNEIEAKRLLESVGDDPLRRNAMMNNTYLALSKQDPTFIWLAGAALGSAKVGQSLHAASMGDLSFMDKTNLGAIYKNLPGGNQDIFTNLIARYLTYKEVGIEGIIQIKNSKMAGDFGPPGIYVAFEQHDQGRKMLEKTADEMGLSNYDQRVLEMHFSNPKNKELALNTAIKLMEHEQDVVQKMYVDELKKAMTDPMSIKVAELLKLTGVSIDGVFYSLPKYVNDPGDIAQRTEYFKVVLTAISDLYTDHTKLNKYNYDVDMAAQNSLWLVNPFIKGFNHIGGNDHIKRAFEYNDTMLKHVSKFADAHSFPGEDYHGFNAVVQKEILYQSLLESDLYYPEMESNEFMDAFFNKSDSYMMPLSIDPEKIFLTVETSNFEPELNTNEWSFTSEQDDRFEYNMFFVCYDDFIKDSVGARARYYKHVEENEECELWDLESFLVDSRGELVPINLLSTYISDISEEKIYESNPYINFITKDQMDFYTDYY